MCLSLRSFLSAKDKAPTLNWRICYKNESLSYCKARAFVIELMNCTLEKYKGVKKYAYKDERN